jgi:hypothetical protein
MHRNLFAPPEPFVGPDAGQGVKDAGGGAVNKCTISGVRVTQVIVNKGI